MILCINKCGPFVNDVSKEMLKLKHEPSNDADADWLKKFREGQLRMEQALAQKFAEKLNLFYEQEGKRMR